MTDQPDLIAAGQPRPADIVGLADSALRTALEFAVGIAAAGQKLRPPLIYPAGLKPYLRSNRLDAAALTAVRRAVVADEPFRDRLGGVDSDLVDELGAAWLRRGDGWEQDVLRLLATARREAADTSAEAALRKSEKRREAAEQAAARAQAQLIAHQDTVSRENNRRERAEEQARLALAQVTGLGQEITGLRRDVARLRSKLDAESSRASRAEADAAVAAEQLLEVERIRDKLLASRHCEDDTAVPQPIPPVEAMPPAVSSSNVQAAQALRQAAAATRELASALVSAGEALDGDHSDESRRHAPPNDSPGPRSKRSNVADRTVIHPIRPRNAHRKPIPIPGGLYGDSVAAAEHMLRVPNVCVIVDGYNLAKLAWPQLELIDQRECCIGLLEDLVRRLGTDIRVVFDGADVVGASSRRRLIRVQFSPQGMSADDVIRRDVGALAPRTPAVVVTNDQAIVTDVRAAGVNIVSTDALLSLAGRRVTR